MTIPTARIRYKRPDILTGTTYKISPPTMNDHVYITVNDAKIDGELRPVELFINTRDHAAFQWIGVLVRMISAQLQQPGDFPSFIITELLESYDPEGGYFVKRRKVNSIAAHIGLVLEEHCKKLGVSNFAT